MKKLGCLLLSGIMVGSMSLPVFGLTVTPVDMSKVDVLIDGEKIEPGKVYQGNGFTFEVIDNGDNTDNKDVSNSELTENEKTYNLPYGLKVFKDVPNASFWAYDAVMSMT